MEQLRQIVQKLMADNEKKKLEISTLRSQLSRGSPVSRLNGYISDENGVIRELGGTPEHRSTPTSVESNHQPRLSNGVSPSITPQPFDINSQLRKLLVEDVKENMAHSSSFPASLCLGTNGQFQVKMNEFYINNLFLASTCGFVCSTSINKIPNSAIGFLLIFIISRSRSTKRK